MAEPLWSHPDEHTPVREPLTLVHGTPDPKRRRGVGRSAAIGAMLGFLVVAATITAAVTARGMGFAASLALGTYVGMFGGAGFGCMVGAVVVLARPDDPDA
jgi:hypothetical protein